MPANQSGNTSHRPPETQFPELSTQDATFSPRRVELPILGLVGGMGSGKSEVAAEFARQGAKVISGDQLGHEALRQPETRAALALRWGPRVLDRRGEIDRRSVGKIVFADANERRVLEHLVFPFIQKRFLDEVSLAERQPGFRWVVLDAAVMLEAGWNKVCACLIYVHSPRVQRLRRLAEQRGWTEKEVESRESAQLPLTEKVSRADFVIDNSGSREQTAQQVRQLLQILAQKPWIGSAQ